MYLGIDLHKRYAQVAVVDGEGELVEEVRVENANLNDLAQRYAGAKAVLEATSNYYHVYDTLAEYLDVTVAHPGKLTLIAQSDKKIDRVDAKEPAVVLEDGDVVGMVTVTDLLESVMGDIEDPIDVKYLESDESN